MESAGTDSSMGGDEGKMYTGEAAVVSSVEALAADSSTGGDKGKKYTGGVGEADVEAVGTDMGADKGRGDDGADSTGTLLKKNGVVVAEGDSDIWLSVEFSE